MVVAWGVDGERLGVITHLNATTRSYNQAREWDTLRRTSRERTRLRALARIAVRCKAMLQGTVPLGHRYL